MSSVPGLAIYILYRNKLNADLQLLHPYGNLTNQFSFMFVITTTREKYFTILLNLHIAQIIRFVLVVRRNTINLDLGIREFVQKSQRSIEKKKTIKVLKIIIRYQTQIYV